MDDKVIEKIEELVKKYPNDGDLGKEIRKFLNSEGKESTPQNTEQQWDLTNGY
jgi:hypothetical protein